MKYSPGSFSKNFAWHGTGLRKLHSAIRAGFHNGLRPVPRQAWRDDSGINDANLELIPINFFLHNRGGLMSIDELVFQAIEKPHSLRFDRLAFFALHLNRAGSGPNVVARPAMWANEFVRDRLWSDDAWHASALPEAEMDAFIATRLSAADVVRIKCRSNYRHLFELCEYIPAKLDLINTGPEQWIGPALFLAWDRFILDGGKADKAELLAVVTGDELYKLLGTSADYVEQQADYLAELYIEAGNLGRFALPSGPATTPPAPPPLAQSDASTSEKKTAATLPAPKPSPAPSAPASAELPEETTGEWIEQEESDATVERQTREVQAQVRNRKKAAALRRHYKNTCVFCSQRLQVGPGRWYSEAAHIKPLGKPHNGPDRISNMIVLCPNHHLQFDRGILRMKKATSGFVLHSEVRGDPLHGQAITLAHDLDEEFVTYHWKWFSRARA